MLLTQDEGENEGGYEGEGEGNRANKGEGEREGKDEGEDESSSSDLEARNAVISFIASTVTLTGAGASAGAGAGDVIDAGDNNDASNAPISLLPVLPLLRHPSVQLAPSTSRLLAMFIRIANPSQRLVFLGTSGSAWALCCTLPIVLSSLSLSLVDNDKKSKNGGDMGDFEDEDDEEDDDDDNDNSSSLLDTWCTAYFAIIDSLLDTFIVHVTSMGDVTPTSQANVKPKANENKSSALSVVEMPVSLDRLTELLLPLLSLSLATDTSNNDTPNNNTIHRAVANALLHGNGQENRVKSLRKKLNRWVKACLKNGLQSPVVVQALTSLVALSTKNRASASTSTSTKTRASTKSGYGKGVGADGDDKTLWGILFPNHDVDKTSSDCFYPSTMLEMIVSHSKFPTLLLFSGSAASHRGNQQNKQKQQKQGPGSGSGFGSGFGSGSGQQQGGPGPAPNGRLNAVNVPLVRLLVVLIAHSCGSSSTQSSNIRDALTSTVIDQTLTTKPTVPHTLTAVDQLLVHQVNDSPSHLSYVIYNPL